MICSRPMLVLHCTHACTVTVRYQESYHEAFCVSVCRHNKLMTRMAHGNLFFDASKENIDDFRHRFEFYCLANNIKDGDATQQNRKKALFLTLVGQATFAKLRDLASPREITEISLDEIMELLKAYYHPKTVEIEERFKFFKHTQGTSEKLLVLWLL